MQLTKGEQLIYDWQYGVQGGFISSLIETILRADISNTHKLSKIYPVEVQAVLNYRDKIGWWENVVKKKERQSRNIL